MSKKLTTEQFISYANTIHKNRYDYSLSVYKNGHTNINIICPIHGVFSQLPQHHIRGSGCVMCSGTMKSNISDFIQNSKLVHGDKYDYSLSVYVNNSTKLTIICNKHGKFDQIPTSHINQKQGCPQCARNIKLTTEEFITQSNEIHNNKYDYSLVEYINSKTKVKITCLKHGLFEQIPDNHIRKGYGCPKCNDSRGEINIKTILDSNHIIYETQKKFKNCKYKQQLKFDFYLPKYNICIEYDGEQHFERFRFEKNDEKLKIRQLRDNIKTEYCKMNNISLIRIKYNDDIKEIINNSILLI